MLCRHWIGTCASSMCIFHENFGLVHIYMSVILYCVPHSTGYRFAGWIPLLNPRSIWRSALDLIQESTWNVCMLEPNCFERRRLIWIGFRLLSYGCRSRSRIGRTLSNDGIWSPMHFACLFSNDGNPRSSRRHPLEDRKWLQEAW